jgi:hypothetical protein
MPPLPSTSIPFRLPRPAPTTLPPASQAWTREVGPTTSFFPRAKPARPNNGLVEWVRITSDGNAVPQFLLDVSGVVHASSTATSSDERFKTNVAPLADALEKVAATRAVSFDWKGLYESLGRSTGRREIGVITQDVEKVFPELVSTWHEEGYRGCRLRPACRRSCRSDPGIDSQERGAGAPHRRAREPTPAGSSGTPVSATRRSSRRTGKHERLRPPARLRGYSGSLRGTHP